MINREFTRIIAFYTAGVVVVLYVMWVLLQLALPEAHINIVHALASAFGINLPDDMLQDSSSGLRAFAVIVIISVLSLGLVVLNVFFGAVITTIFIRPRVNMVTSARGVLSVKWNPASPYVLVRLASFHRHGLADVRLSVMLTVQETRATPEGDDTFVSFFPIENFTPQRILVMKPKMPWSIAVPADAHLSNSMTKDYHFHPGEPITQSFSAGKNFKHVKRSLDILIQGVDTKSYTEFVIHRKTDIDEQDGDKYTLHLHRGAFKSLPLEIAGPELLEQYVD